jgi:hypothetical protein
MGLMTMAHPSPPEQGTHPKPATTVPVPAQRWTADAPLREGMGRIQKALNTLRRYESGHLNEAAALEQVAAIQDAGSYIFTHCTLAPDADAALHSMLAPLLIAAQALKDDPHDVAAIAAMRDAVADFPRYFDDPDWSARITSQPK